MRTTLELPDDLLRRAKIVAVERGTTLRELIGKALAQELGVKDFAVAKPKRATFPIFSSKAPGTLDLTAQDIADSEVESRVLDGEQVWLLRPRKAANRPWLASLRDKTAVKEHAMERIRESIAEGKSREGE